MIAFEFRGVADYETHRSPHRFEYAGAANVHV
jgi:hypothetical protein